MGSFRIWTPERCRAALCYSSRRVFVGQDFELMARRYRRRGQAGGYGGIRQGQALKMRLLEYGMIRANGPVKVGGRLVVGYRRED